MTAFDSALFRYRLHRKGLTYKQLATAVGCTEQRIKQVATGAIPPDELQARIARHLSISISDLWPACVRAGVR